MAAQPFPYVVVAGSQPHRDHIDLRDFLRAYPGQAARYGDLKHRLAGVLATDRLAYGEGKAEMIAEFLRQARILYAGSKESWNSYATPQDFATVLVELAASLRV